MDTVFNIALYIAVSFTIAYTLLRLVFGIINSSINDESKQFFSYHYLMRINLEHIESERGKKMGRAINIFLRILYFVWAITAVMMIVEFFRGLQLT